MAGIPTQLEPIADQTGKVTPRWRAWLATLRTGATTSTFTDPITLTSGQIAFPATQAASTDANTLDDYEEGTFTPTIAFGGAAVSVVYTAQIGRYTKIGNRVFIDIALAISSRGSSTGSATIQTLPFTPATNIAAAWAVTNYTIGAGLIPAFDTVGSTTIRLRSFNPTSGNDAAVAETQVDNDFQVKLSLQYSV
jgi:hypothetical protein